MKEPNCVATLQVHRLEGNIPALTRGLTKSEPEWWYSHYRATLYRAGKFFAIITPDGRHDISTATESILLNALNTPVPTPAQIEQICAWRDLGESVEAIIGRLK